MNNDVSPTKSVGSRGVKASPMTRKSTQVNQSQQQDPKDLLQGLTEKEVEIEHLKTIIVA